MKSGSKISDPILQQVVLATGEFPKNFKIAPRNQEQFNVFYL